MASSMLTAEKATSASTEADADEALNTVKHSCANDPDFAVICDFLQKFSKDLGLDLPNFKQLLDWFTKTNEVSPKLRDMQIKLLRKTRKTVHEKSWESALSKFCFTYSAQDAWEIERFGYKNSSVKVKLRVLRELLECQFERNSKFRAKILTLSADSLRSQPIGRDRLGHAYWVTQDNDCNLRIYQEHLDEEIWQVVATNRDEFVNLIKRLRGSEVVLPSSDIGIIDEDTSSNNSTSQTCSESLPKPPPPEKQDDSQEDEQKVPKLSIKILNERNSKDDATKDVGKGEEELAAEEDAKLVKKTDISSDSSESDEGEFEEVEEEYDDETDEDDSEDEDETLDKDKKMNTTKETKFLDDSKKVKPLLISQNKIVNIATSSTNAPKKRTFDQANSSSPIRADNQQLDSLKKSRPSLLDSKRSKPLGKYKDSKARCEEEYEETAAEDDIEEEVEEEDIDSVAAEEDENEEKQIEEFDEDDDDDNEVGEEITDPVVRVVGEGSGKEYDVGNSWFNFEYELDDDRNENIVGDIIEEDIIYVRGDGYGTECLVGNNKNESDTSNTIIKTPIDTAQDAPFVSKISDTKSSNDIEQPECLKISPSKEDVSKVDCEKDKLVKTVERDTDNHGTASVKESKSECETKEINKTEVSPINGENNHKSEKFLVSTSSSDTQQSAPSSNCNKTKIPDDEKLKKIQEIPTEPENLSTSKPNMENSSLSKPESKMCDKSKQIHATKMSVLECLKKELRESKQKSMEKSAVSIGEANKVKQPNPTILNRKRRLADLTALSVRPSNSESEIEVNSENPEELPNEHTPDIDELDVGGKRLKMRAKQTNSELRKKVEAQKVAANEENTSSSGGEEESRRRRKIILPKKHADQNLLKSEEIEFTKKNTNGEKLEGLAPQLVSKASSCNIATSQKLPIRKTACKNKPTLDEIIEKKLKKTPEKNNDECVSVPISKKNDVDLSTKSILPPPSKSPITKPLKKTLLSQIRQEQNDDDAVPRKRTNSEDLIPPVLSDLKSSTKNEPLIDSTSTNDIDNQKNTPERQRKRRSSEETADADAAEEPEAKKEVTCVNLKEKESETADTNSANEDIEVSIKKNIVKKDSMSETLTPITGRRSGRRGGLSTSVFVESPQLKRTRGCVKNSMKKDVHDVEDDKTDRKKENIISNKSKDLEKNEDQNNSSDKPTSKEGNSQIETKSTELNKNQTPKPQATTKSPIKGNRKQREVDATNIIQLTDNETPVRQSRRIAQQKIREEAERRKLEEIALRTMKKELKKKKKAEKEADPTVVPPSESSSESEESDVETKRKVQKKKCPGKNGSWSSGSEEQDEPEEIDEEPHRYETDPGSPLFKSDHEFSPESDIEDESQVVPMKRARTVRKEDADDDELDEEEEACQKCNKSDHPEWILLCDNCDKGYHCSCLSPVLFYIPEGDWYCPPCQQEQLIKALECQLKEFDDLVENKKKEDEKEQLKLAEEEKARQDEQTRKSKNKNSKNKANRKNYDSSEEGSSQSGRENDEDETGSSDESVNKSSAKNKNNSRSKSSKKNEKRNHRNRRQNVRNSRNLVQKSESDSDSGSQHKSKRATKINYSSSSSSSTYSESDDEPIYKLRKRRQINVSYRLNEYDEIINSALKKEMDEAAGAGNLGRGKDISTIIEADKEEKARQKQLGDEEPSKEEITKPKEENEKSTEKTSAVKIETVEESKEQRETVKEDSDDEPINQKFNIKRSLKKKSRKLTTLDISSGDDDGSDEDFKGSSLDDDDEEDTSISASNSDSSLEIYKRYGKSKKKRRKAARKASRRRRKDRKFVVDESDDEEVQRPKSKKKRKDDSDYTESDAEDDDLSELSENIDSADLCDDTTTDESDGAWRPNNRKKAKKSSIPFMQKSPKPKKPETKKPKKVEYSDDDISETEEEDDDENEDGVGGGKGMGGKQPRSQPLKSTAPKTKGKGKGGATSTKTKKKKKSSEDESSVSDSADSTRRTRGRRYAYMEDFDDSSDGGIKPGVQRPDTPPEEREKFIKRQEEIKRMLAEKNAEGAKLAATPRLTPIKTDSEKDKRSPVKAGGDSLSTVPLSVIRQAKVLDIDYLQRRGESLDDLGNEVGDVDDDFDDVDLPNDLPEDMDEDTIARMVEEEEEFGAAAARELPTPDEVLRAPTSVKPKIKEVVEKPPILTTSVAPFPVHAPPQIPVTLPASGLQEPVRKRLPMPTMHPPLLRHQFFLQDSMTCAQHLMQRHSGPPTSHFLQSALSAPLTQPIDRNYPPSLPHPSHHSLINRMTTHNIPLQPTVSHALSATRPPFSNSTKSTELIDNLTQQKSTNIRPEGETKPRGRRKKITPLRDPFQKQQAAAAVTAATATNSVLASAGANTKETVNASLPSSVIKGGPPMKVQMQTNVITSMPPSTQSISSRPSLGGIYARPEGPRFYDPHVNRPGVHRQRGLPQMPPSLIPPHPTIRSSYGPPPPLKGSSSSTTSSAPGGSIRTPMHHVPTYVGMPPNARHSAPHLNLYRPSMYGNPNFGPRVNLRHPNIHASEYSTGSRAPYAPYGFYPPPPPLTAPGLGPPSAQMHQAKPSTTTSVIVSATAAASSTSASISSGRPTHPPPPLSEPSSKSGPSSQVLPIKTSPLKSASPSRLPQDNKIMAEPRKKLTTLQAYTTESNTKKSPQAIERPQSHSSSPRHQTEVVEDLSSTPGTSDNASTVDQSRSEGHASEFSGLVSYFSSQHDDYNT